MRILRLRFRTKFFRKLRNTCPLQKKGMTNERASQEKQFKHIFGVRGEWEITKIWARI